MTTIAKYTLVELVNKIKSKEISAVDATNAYVERIQKSKKLNAFVTETLESALEQAKKADEINQKYGALSCAPIAVKDLFCTKNVQTTASSKILKNFIPIFVLSIRQSEIDFCILADRLHITFLSNVFLDTIWLKAVFSPENEKLGFFDLYRGLGKL